LAKKEEKPPVKREVPTVPPKREGIDSTPKKDTPPVPVRREMPKPPKRDDSKPHTPTETKSLNKETPPVPVRREPPKPPKRNSDVKIEEGKKPEIKKT